VLALCFTFGGTIYASAQDKQETNAVAETQKTFSIVNAIARTQDESRKETVKAASVTDKSAVLQWKSESLGYSYSVCKYNVFKEAWDEVLTTTKTSAKLTGLTADTEYDYCVISEKTGEMLGIGEFHTSIAPPTVSVKNYRSNKLVLSLKNVPKNSTVELYRKGDGKKYKKIATLKNKTTYTDKNLKDATTYTYKAKVKTATTESAFGKEKKAKTLKKMGLPSVSGKTKTYAYYTAVTSRSSPQYKLLRSEECYTDEETGIRMVDDCYCVALGSYYGTKIGTKYKITFSNGNTIKVILCDQKANRHTDSKHQYAVNNKDIVEFYVERSMMPRSIRNRGNYGLLSQFSGSVVSIEKYV